MKKLRLDPETLAVQSFTTLGLPGARGTVRGAQDAAASGFPCYPTTVECGSGMCAPTPPSVGCTDYPKCDTASDCEIQPWTIGQYTCQTCPGCVVQPWTNGQNTCATCPGMPGC